MQWWRNASLILLSVTLLCTRIVYAYKTIIDVLSEDPQFEKLIQHLQFNRLIPRINSLEAGTLFAPVNDAFDKFGGKEITKDLLLYHLLPVGMTGQDFYHGQLLESLYVRPGLLGSTDNPGQRIKITKDGKPGKGRGKVYINGAEIIKKDVFVNNQTYIQVIDRVLDPPAMLGDTLRSTNDEVYALMKGIGLIDLVNQPRPFTVFLSRKSVFNPFNDIEKTYITSQYGQDDLSRLIRYTVIDGLIYSANFPSGKTVHKTISGDSVLVSVDKDNAITVNNIPMSGPDVLAANGVIHEIDDMIVPDSIVFDTRKYLYGMNATKFVSLLDSYGLSRYLQNDTQKLTFLVPSNEDIDEDAIPDNEKRDWLSYHVVTGLWTPESLQDGLLLSSEFKSPELKGSPQRLPVYVQAEDVDVRRSLGKSIRFGHSRVLADAVVVNDNVIYGVSEPLSLPGDILPNLVADLDLSTFIATLYVSEVANAIEEAKGITLFVPTNDAFRELGLVAQYLVHPTGKRHLQDVLRYHVADSLLYRDTMVADVHEVPTLAEGATLRISPEEDGQHIIVGRPEGGGGTPGSLGTVTQTDILVSNGVVHKLNRVQIPGQVEITNADLLRGIEANTMMEVLERAGLLSELNRTELIVLAPTDKAFARIDLDELFQNQYELERLAKLHLIPLGWQDQWMHGDLERSSSSRNSYEYSSLLSDRDKVIIHEEQDNEWVITVKDQSEGEPAHVTGMGRSIGSVGGGVLVIDSVLIPVERGLFGLPYGWAVALVTASSVVGASTLGVCGFFGWKIWTRRRLGYRSID